MIPDFRHASWTKSKRSQQTTDQCVELSTLGGYAAVRDSMDPDGPKLIFKAAIWRDFARQVKTGAYDAEDAS